MFNLKRAVVALVMVFSVAKAHAGIGMHGGLNLADVSVSSGLPTVSTTEFMLGVFYESEGTLFHFQPEFNYVKKGYGNFLVVPLLAKIKFDSPVVKPFLLAGPAIGFKVEGAATKTFDFSLDAGGGVEFDVAPTIGLLVEARYSFGLVNVNALGGSTVKTRGIYILAGVHVAL